jgi:hypothetical protein
MTQIAQPDEEYKMDMTPMIDVVFLLIVFFICIEFKVLESKLDAFLPADKGARPTLVEPKNQLVVRVHLEQRGTQVQDPTRPARFQLKGHKVRLEVGPRVCATFEAGEQELSRIAVDPSSMIPDRATGGRKLMSCVIEGYPGTCYEDIARTADLCRAAGFVDIHFGAGI